MGLLDEQQIIEDLLKHIDEVLGDKTDAVDGEDSAEQFLRKYGHI